MEGWVLEILCCDPEGSRGVMQILCEAFGMGYHKRLGAVSLVLALHPEVVRMVVDQV